MNGYDQINEMKRDLRSKGIKVTIPDLLALSRNNDPFFAGSSASVRDAEWFAEMVERFSLGYGFHIRKIHYRMVTQPPGTILKPNGMAYENTHLDWTYLNNCSRHARYLNTVDARLFRDKRNAEPEHCFCGYADTELRIENPEPHFSLPAITSTLFAPWNRVPDLEINGYDYDSDEQPYSLWLVIEKSTEDDSIRPICHQLGVTYLEGTGFQSITRVLGMIEREENIGKPVRVFWLSDFDPAGESMPVSMARQIEFWGQARDIDIKLHHLLLTREQCIKYELPRTPIKKTDKRASGWEKRYGEGATELDALNALHPGELERIIREGIEPYVDLELRGKIDTARSEAKKSIADEWRKLTREDQDTLRAIGMEAGEVASKYEEELERLKTALDKDMEQFRERLKPVQHAIQEKAGEMTGYLVERPDAEADGTDESAWLFDSKRDYLEQMRAYRQFQGKEACDV